MRASLFLPLVFIFLLTSLSSCKYSEHDKTFTYNDAWSIDYPSWFKKSKYVYPGSEFQISNGYRDTYVFVRELVGLGGMDFITDSLKNKLAESLEDVKVETDSTYTIDGATFRTLEITGLLNDKRMYYLLSLIESGEKQIQFTGWMFNHKRELWEADYKEMLHSWKQL